jgi:ABC-2 type transport system ATP-binding protein
VIIISRGKLVATDSVANLTNRLRGSEAVSLEVVTSVPASEIRQALEQIPGVSRVVLRNEQDSRRVFEIESIQGENVRAELARAVVHAGWNLNELRPMGFSLEDIFLQLTASEKKSAAPAPTPTEEPSTK